MATIFQCGCAEIACGNKDTLTVMKGKEGVGAV